MAEHASSEGTELGNASDTCPCVKGCGYYGTSSTLNMCSKCFREHVRQEQQRQVESVCQQQQLQQESLEKSERSPKQSEGLQSEQIGLQQDSSATESQMGLSELQVEPTEGVSLEGNSKLLLSPCQTSESKGNRCHYCQKKVGLTGFTCRCGSLFCADHRYSDKHDCTFDYKAENKKVLSRANPQVISAKLNKI